MRVGGTLGGVGGVMIAAVERRPGRGFRWVAELKPVTMLARRPPELGAFSSGIKPGWDYPPAFPSWHGVSGACSD